MRVPSLSVRRWVLAAAVAAGLAASPAALAASPSDTLGVFAGPGDPAAVASFEQKVGHRMAVVQDYIGKDSWATIESPTWWPWVWTPSAYGDRMMFTVPMLPDTGGTLSAGAAGNYDSHFVALAKTLVAGGQGSAIIRLGHEFNGNWYRWTIAVPNGAADYAAYWRRIVTAMRSVSGANFRFDWSAISGSSWVDGKSLDAAAAYPGDAYVDFIGLDQYDQSWISGRTDPAKRWAGYLDAPNGLRWQQGFAAAHGKPMTFPEWGLALRTDGYGGGDSPEFIGYMYDWIAANNVAYNAYFNYADGIIEARIFNGSFPNAAARFVSLFGSGTTTATPPPPPPPPPPSTKPGKKPRR